MERSLVAANYSRTRECILSGNNNKHRQEKATETMIRNNGSTCLPLPLVPFCCNLQLKQRTRVSNICQVEMCLLCWPGIKVHFLMSFVSEMPAAVDLPLTTTAVSVCIPPYPGTTPNGHAKKSCTRQIDYAATETCAINLSAKGLPWIALRRCKSSEMLPSHECNWSQVERWLNSIISLVKGRKVLGGGRGSSRFETLMAGSHAKCSGASFCLQQNKVNLLR